MGFFGIYTMYQFMFNLGKLIQRRYLYKFQKSEINRMYIYFDKLIEAPLSQKLSYDL